MPAILSSIALLILLLLGGARAASAAPSSTVLEASATSSASSGGGAVSYALVVGSNAPGPGQDALAFAEDDAREVAEVLRELGGVARERVTLVLRPTPQALLAAVAALERAVVAEQAAGRQARVFFYYSGHAKASGLSLGAEELPLETLRAKLFATGAALTVVVLDACQSGAFSRIKGAEPAADFSFNSKARLDATGVAVLASSTGSELSQESDFLRSSYFTHHFLIGLRGAADTNRDGEVSLDEAYRYTYHQTLVATAATAVGKQHVSVEMELKGAGEIPLSFPEKATATLTLPARAEGHVLVVRMPARAVTAELHKARGAELQVAVAPGRYQVLLRTEQRVLRCEATAGAGTSTVALDRCAAETPARSTAKGGGFGPAYHFSLVAGLGGFRDDGYIDRLEDFGYHSQKLAAEHFAVAGLRRIHRNALVGGQLALLGGQAWERTTTMEPLQQTWSTYTAGAVGRAELGTVLVGYVQLGAGLALTRERFRDQDGEAQADWHPGIYVDGALGLDWMIGERWGLTARTTASFAPSLPNLLGDRHDTGLFGVDFGVVVHR